MLTNESSERECNCSIHVTIRAWQERIGYDSLPEQGRFAFDDMVEAWIDADADASYRRAILDGTWPGAEQILERALQKVRTKNGTSLSISPQPSDAAQ